jgi:hypothetical protein
VGEAYVQIKRSDQLPDSNLLRLCWEKSEIFCCRVVIWLLWS